MKLSILSVICFISAVIAEDLENDIHVSPHIFYGHDVTNIKKAPYQVSIQYRGSHICGGTIISKDWVITAARCVVRPHCCYTIRAGSLRHNEGGTVHKVAKIIIHEHFNMDTNGFATNDMALIQISVPIIIDQTHKPLALANINRLILPGVHISMYGWGDTTSNVQSALKVFKTRALDKTMCNVTYGKYGGIYDNQGCADDFNGKTSLCSHDAGGPIVFKFRLFAILSWTEGCGRQKYPGVFTEISPHRFWIRRHSGI